MIDSDNTSQAANPRPLLIVLTEPGKTVSAQWYERLHQQFDGSIAASGDGACPEWVESLPDARGPWWQWLSGIDSDRTAGGVLLVAAGLELPERFGQRIEHLFQAPQAPALATLPGNHEPGLDPASAAISRSPATLDSIVQAAAELAWTTVRHQPRRVALIAPGRLDEALSMRERRHCALYDGLRIHDAAADQADTPPRSDLGAALGALGDALDRLELDGKDESEDAPRPLFGFDGKPVILHISHDWGGGVARWIDDLVGADTAHNHLVFSAGGPTDGLVHGQWLTLYAGGPGRSPVRRWTLAPAIAGTDIEHAAYREILEAVIQRFGVARIVVSSLIGHSLDALDTGLPTLCMLHDYYPAWPVLDQDPLAWAQTDGPVEIERAIAASGRHFLFQERRAGHWQALARAWRERAAQENVSLVAPAEHVLARWRRLVDDPLERAVVIPHGFAGWPSSAPIAKPRALPDGRLNLVVVGRLTRGKGLALLESALADLQPHARLTLLGCGYEGMRFFGRPDVDIILDYQRDALPRHLARIGAQAVLFLSTVAETWNYVLTETRTLGLVPLATRTGSFAERIRDGVDGVLFEPDAESLAAVVAELHQQPRQLEQLRANLPAEPGVDEVLEAIERQVALRPAPPRPAAAAETGDVQGGTTAGQLVGERRAGQRLAVEVEALRDDLAERTDWARKFERMAEQRTRWARSLEDEVGSLKLTIESVKQTMTERLEAADRELQIARSDAEAQRARVDELDAELQTIFASRSWRITRPMRVLNRVAANALRRRAYNPLQWPRLLGRLAHNLRIYGLHGALEIMQQGGDPRQSAAPEFRPTAPTAPDRLQPVTLASAETPLVSIVVPVFNKVHYTSACLNSLAEHAGAVDFEVIVVDDCSEDETGDYLADCSGIRVIRNATNSGFIASCNAGAEAARGRYLVFLNNDTTVTAGWLEALTDTFSEFPDTGIVGARLVYPDGRLQEAGGIVFNDASGWNYGRGDSPDRPAYTFACEADYVSGACLAIECDLFDRLGGFDKHYAPAYYEDTDLCFRVREHGLRVIYQPGSTIVHHEGISSGTDESSGTKRYQAINREKFSQRWREQLGNQPEPVPGPEAVDAVYRARHHRSRGHVLVVDATTPEPDKDSGSMRLVALLRILRDLGFRVSFMPENLAWIRRYTEALQTSGIEVLHLPEIGNLEDGLAVHARRLDHVIVSRHYVLTPLLPAIRKHCPEAQLIFDTVDLHFLREERMAELGGDDKAARTARKTREQELALIERSDATLVVSPVEQELLRELSPKSRVQVLSNIHHIHGSRREWSRRRDLLFVGGFQHPPNLDAAEWLIEEIMPGVREQLGEVRLHLIGSRMPESLRERRGDGVVIHGYVEELAPYLEGCRLSLAPLRYGAGVKGKVNQAMAWGLPVVATSCAAEGMYLEDGRDVLLADTTEAFVEAIVRAYSDEALWTTLSHGGLANVEKYFSFDAARRAVSELMEPENQKIPENLINAKTQRREE